MGGPIGRNVLVAGEPRTDDDGAFDRVATASRDRVRDEPGASLRDLHRTPGVAETVDMDYIEDEGQIRPLGPDSVGAA